MSEDNSKKVRYKNFSTYNNVSLTLEDICMFVLGESLDDCPGIITEQLSDIVFELFPYWWNCKVRNECNNIRAKLRGSHVLCEECGKVTDKFEIHHIVSPLCGGGNDRKNLKILCHDCHKDTMKSDYEG